MTNPNTKLRYLSKYLDDDDDGGDRDPTTHNNNNIHMKKKKKETKKKKTKKTSKPSQYTTTTTTTITENKQSKIHSNDIEMNHPKQPLWMGRLVDEDEEEVVGTNPNHHFRDVNHRDDDPDDDDDDDRPLIVPSEELPVEARPSLQQTRGSWEMESLPMAIKHPSSKHRQDSDDDNDNDDDNDDDNNLNTNDSHQPRRRQRKRYDSSDDDLSSGKNNNNGEVRERRWTKKDDSQIKKEDISNVKQQVQRESSSRRRRYDSDDNDNDDDDENKNKNNNAVAEMKKARRRRYDSDDDDNNDNDNANRSHKRTTKDSPSTLGIKREDSTSPKLQRKRYDSDGTSEDGPHRNERVDDHPPRRSRYDSDSDENRKPTRVRSRYDTDSDDDRKQTRRRRRYDSDTEKDAEPSNDATTRNGSTNTKERMSSGHVAGLQKAHDFTTSERQIQQEKHKEAQRMVDKYGVGETVYRDKEGRKVDPAKAKDGVPPVNEEEQRRLNQGKVQLQAQQAAEREMEYLKQSSFARHADDDRLEDMRKAEIRKGDPMADYAQRNSKKRKASSSSSTIASGFATTEPERPVYKGPPAKPNRFGIRPGYRWDGVDRGNGFEDKLLANQFSVARKREEAYRWTSADM